MRTLEFVLDKPFNVDIIWLVLALVLELADRHA